MDMLKLVQCLSDEEKFQLRKLLGTELSELQKEYSALTIFEWCDKVHPSTRLYNGLHAIYYHNQTVLIKDVNTEELLRYRNLGGVSIAEFIRLRGF